jgi:hypothetical protein
MVEWAKSVCVCGGLWKIIIIQLWTIMSNVMTNNAYSILIMFPMSLSFSWHLWFLQKPMSYITCDIMCFMLKYFCMWFIFVLFFETGSDYVIQAGLRFTILLSQPSPKYWDYKHVPHALLMIHCNIWQSM